MCLSALRLRKAAVPSIAKLPEFTLQTHGIYWADSSRGKLDPPVVGSFENKVGHFFTKDVFNGKPVLMVFRWDARDKENPVWSQALSEDKGINWEWNWYMYMSKIK